MIWIILLSFIIIIASVWWMGFWSNVITLITLIMAGLIASSFYHTLALRLDETMASFVYLNEFIAVWLLFFFSFGFMRALTELLSHHRLKFDVATEMVGRSFVSIWIACVFVCFASFTLHLAPLSPASFQQDINTTNFGVGPDRLWLAFIQSRSRGALSESQDTSMWPAYIWNEHPDDAGANLRVFDPHSTFIPDNIQKRQELSNLPALRVN